MSATDQKFQDAAKRRDHALRELIRNENNPNHYNGRIEAIRNYAANERNPTKQKRMQEMADRLEQKRTTLVEKQKHLQLDYDRANRQLAEQISQVKNPDDRLKLSSQARRRQEEIHLKEAGKSSSELNRKNMKTTLKFMEQNGASQRQIQDFAKGTDFSQAVKVERLPANKSLSQRVHQNGRRGPYYSDPGVAANRAGISSENRQHQRFKTSEPTQVLSSKAASINDSFTNRAKKQPARGGNTQYWVPKKEQHKVKSVAPTQRVKTPPQNAPAKQSQKTKKPTPRPTPTKPKKPAPTPRSTPKAATPKRSPRKAPPPQRPAPKPKNVIRRKGAASDIAVKNGRGIKIPNKQIKSPKPKLK